MVQKSQKLLSLAQQLRLYKPQYSLTEEHPQQRVPKEGTNSVSQSLNSTAESAGINNRAAVLVCIFEGNDSDLRVFLTKRSSSLSSHSGEVALPGGKREDGDADDIETALREAQEEIGLDPALVDVVAVLEPFVTLSGIAVVPVVGILFDKKAFVPSPNANEVEAIFDVPVEMFLKDENHRTEKKQWLGYKYSLHYFDYQTGSQRNFQRMR
ncbi:hypothetical protein MANES_16G035400v8 [Manihot esculenta]|uniref:Nudix hydrolase domain-containing protein n=1 Tax=Manihot esculenta TaxID=3983 RepID=A0A2C9U872_MANES|nr:hypothetical protein MANES_16G035400v8 [Manihot esculenta]